MPLGGIESRLMPRRVVCHDQLQANWLCPNHDPRVKIERVPGGRDGVRIVCMCGYVFRATTTTSSGSTPRVIWVSCIPSWLAT